MVSKKTISVQEALKESRKQFWKNSLKPLSPKKLVKYDFVGFDVETIGKTNDFYLGGITFYKYIHSNYKDIYLNEKIVNEKRVDTGQVNDKGEHKIFVYRKYYCIDAMRKELLGNEFKGKYIVATNLAFDFNAVYFESENWNDFKILYRGSDILHAVYKSHNANKKGSSKFIDTWNYVPFGVAQLGKVLGISKLTPPEFLGKRIPVNEQETKELEDYNMMDCKISMDFMYFLQEGINMAGGKLKISIASSSLDVYRRNFLNKILIKEEYVLKDKNVRNTIFNSYYGGRTECFIKGHVKQNIFYYDVNSLYPSVMQNKFPLPQSIKKIKKPSVKYIMKYEGITECFVSCPETNKPFLPKRHEKLNKLIFPKGEFNGTFTNVELRKAIELGYLIMPKKQYIYTETFYPFKDFVNYFYKKRMEYKEQGNSFELVTKLIMNSLYGKFAERRHDTYIVINKKFVEDMNYVYDVMPPVFNENEKFYFGIKEQEYNGNHSFPILSSYVTSYARILMYDYIKEKEVLYTDTDCVITTKDKGWNSKKLGEMKFEGKYKSAFIVRPKFYYLELWETPRVVMPNYYKLGLEYCLNHYKTKFVIPFHVRMKGLSKANIDDFNFVINGKEIKKIKFFKLRESIRRKKKVNEVQEIIKKFSLDDNKRKWYESESDLLYSKPFTLIEKEAKI